MSDLEAYRDFGIEIPQNNIINETSLLDNLAKQLELGLITKAEIIAKLRHLPLTQAKLIKDVIEEENKQEQERLAEFLNLSSKEKEEQNKEERSKEETREEEKEIKRVVE